MNSENHQKVINFLKENKRATARQLAKVLDRDSTGARYILMHLLRKGIIRRCGTTGFPEMRLPRVGKAKYAAGKRRRAISGPGWQWLMCAGRTGRAMEFIRFSGARANEQQNWRG
ncbi:winged helix-turn-helix transcriptional regulator [Cedecea neteri]|uniref:winged helix-turn-helix domain-containing protein n=1 Tax=Cedecea neteri TaxID=158822 RepID=UPI00289F1B10|nr:winged helix-turn-helix transcriptional regulator [Cedecea neteri]